MKRGAHVQLLLVVLSFLVASGAVGGVAVI
jgi:predicted small secreted protein